MELVSLYSYLSGFLILRPLPVEFLPMGPRITTLQNPIVTTFFFPIKISVPSKFKTLQKITRFFQQLVPQRMLWILRIPIECRMVIIVYSQTRKKREARPRKTIVIIEKQP